MKRYVYVVLMLIIGTSLMACSSNKLEVSFDSMGGSQVESVKVEDGKTISMPDVTREGYVLEGWYTSLNDGKILNEEWLFDSDTVTEDFTLYAKWKIEGFVFDQETGSITGYNGKVRDVIIPSEINGTPVTSIGDSAFSKNFLLSVTIPDSVTTIGDNAFYYNRLTSLTVPDSVTTIGERAFFANDLESITILGDETRFNEDWTMIGYPAELHQEATNFNGFLFVDDLKEIIGYIGDDKEIVIPSEINGTEVTSIGYGAFYENELTGATIPDSITRIGSYAFYDNDLTSVAIPNAVTRIGERAFSINNLTSVIIPNSVITMGNYAFSSNALTSVTISDNIVSIGKRAFYSNYLTSVVIPNGVTSIGERAFYFNELTSVNIPDSVITIGSKAFAANDITSITIPESVTTIGYEAFSSSHMHITSETSITILGDETRFDEDWVKIGLPAEFNPRAINVNGLIFYGDTNTIIGYIGENKDIAIPSEINGIEVMHIGYRAFSFNKLTSVIIPDSVTTIEAYAFFTNDLTSVEIPNSVTSIGEWAFYYNSLTSITLSDTLTTIGDYAFFNNSITNFTIPDSVTTIGEQAFDENRITDLTIPESVTTIGNQAFDTNPLITITILGDETRFNDDWEDYGFFEDLKPES
ncbi:leucine-rich repeat protein [Mycoplasmatota bacterium]|nr:leucine-rich repeat protein [Mycoplasmatota bacterium]